VIQKMTVDEFAAELQSPTLQRVQEGFYSNDSGQVGYRATYRNETLHLWFSISATETPFAPDEVTVAITAPTRWVRRENPYPNKRGSEGFEATVHSGGHAFMLGAARRRPRFS
jgi:hypothetical protein